MRGAGNWVTVATTCRERGDQSALGEAPRDLGEVSGSPDASWDRAPERCGNANAGRSAFSLDEPGRAAAAPAAAQWMGGLEAMGLLAKEAQCFRLAKSSAFNNAASARSPPPPSLSASVYPASRAARRTEMAADVLDSHEGLAARHRVSPDAWKTLRAISRENLALPPALLFESSFAHPAT